jgi:lysophospholipase L1-like esterase
MLLSNENVTVLFQGDSVTDCGRDRENPLSLGDGYPLIAAGMLAAMYPDTDFCFINKGVSGDRVRDLERRWDEDCVSLDPTVVSILIGINDVWRRYDSEDPIGTEEFKEQYSRILSRVKTETEARLLILEPFLIPADADKERFREDLDPKITAIRKLAREFGAIYVPLDGLFAAACMKKPPAYYAEDGIHPTVAGHGFIAKKLTEAL